MSHKEITDPVLHAFADEVGPEGPVAVVGARTRWSIGGEVDPEARLVSAPKGVVEYSPDEMTVQVRAGTPVADFHAELAEKGQLTALPDRGGTVGGALAVGENDLRTLGRGRLRTSLLQVRYVSADARLVTGGGPTVKNVTGFDLPRLMVGSLGSLGLLCEVILRTNPVPPVSALLRSDDVDPFAVADAVLRPAMVLWDGSSTWVELAGHGKEVEGERVALSSVGHFTETDVVPDLPGQRWSLAPSELRSLGRPEGPATGRFVASVGVGLVFAERPPTRPTVDPGVRLINDRMKTEFDPTRRLNPGRDPVLR